MKTRTKILIGVLALGAVGAIAGVQIKKGQKKGVAVAMHTVAKEDLVAKVSGTGKIEAMRKVDISANVMGPIVNLAVREGDRVTKGQFLLQIDRAQLAAQASGSAAGLKALLADRDASRSNLNQIESDFARAEKNFSEKIISEADYSRARSAREGARANLDAVERRIEQSRATLAASQDSLSKTTILSPIEGIVTALPVEEGEIAVIGTMNNAGTKLMTISDMSVVQADMSIDETDIPSVALGQRANIRVDAFPDQSFEGTVSEISSSPIVRQGTADSAVEFSVKIVLKDPPASVRPGFSVSGEIQTGERTAALAIPVQALVLQDLADKVAAAEAGAAEASSSTEVKKVAQRDKAKDVEGVFLVDGTKVKFVAVKTGLQGELSIEVTEGLKEGDRIVTGPFRSLRTLKDGDLVREEEKKGPKGRPSGSDAERS